MMKLKFMFIVIDEPLITMTDEIKVSIICDLGVFSKELDCTYRVVNWRHPNMPSGQYLAYSPNPEWVDDETAHVDVSPLYHLSSSDVEEYLGLFKRINGSQPEIIIVGDKWFVGIKD
jgi:hypothetical protein